MPNSISSSLNLLKSSLAEHRIRSIGATDISLMIEDSGMISLIITDDQEEISDPYVTKTPLHNTDVSPLSKKLAPRTITDISNLVSSSMGNGTIIQVLNRDCKYIISFGSKGSIKW